MTELVLTALYYGLWLALFLVVSLLIFSAYFLLRTAWKRGWIEKVGRSIKRFVIWSQPYVKRLFRWLARVLPKLPGVAGNIVEWVVKKIGIILRILFMLSLIGIAFGLFLWAIHVSSQTQYEGLLFVEFVKWGIIAIAGTIGLAAAIPLFGLVRKLAS